MDLQALLTPAQRSVEMARNSTLLLRIETMALQTAEMAEITYATSKPGMNATVEIL